MIKRTQIVEIDLYTPYKIELVYHQYDDSQLIATILEHGESANFDRAYTNYRLTDGQKRTWDTDVTFNKNVVTIDIPDEVLEETGVAEIELVFMCNGQRISSFIFSIIIEPSIGKSKKPPINDLFIMMINTDEWILQPDSTYEIIVPAEAHNLDLNAYVTLAERLIENVYEPVTFFYERENGTLTLITDIPYDGRIILRR